MPLHWGRHPAMVNKQFIIAGATQSVLQAAVDKPTKLFGQLIEFWT